MRFKAIFAAIAAAFVTVPAAAQDPIAQSVEMLGNYDSDGAKEVLDAACKGGNAEACWRLALVMSEDYSDDARELTDKQFLANCAKGEARSCFMIERRVSFDPDAKSKAQGVTALRKACDGGLGFACADLADSIDYDLDDDKTTEAQKREIVGLYEKACTLGSRRGCHSAGDYLGNTYENPLADVAKAITYQAKACDLGEAEACASLPSLEQAQMGEDVSPTTPQLQRWQRLRQRACELGDSDQCESWLKAQVNVP